METSGRRTVTGLAFAAIIFAVVTSIGTITHGQTRTTSQTDETYTGSGSGTNGFCNFSSEVMATANQIRNLPRFIALEGGAIYTLVSAYQSSGVATAYIGGTTLPDGTVRWATTVYYPPSWSFWFMPFPTYC